MDSGGAVLAVLVIALVFGIWAEFASWVRSKLSPATKILIMLAILAFVFLLASNKH